MLEDVEDVDRTSLEDCPEEGDQVKREDGASVQLSSISWKRESFGCTKVEPRNEKNQVVSLFRARARALSSQPLVVLQAGGLSTSPSSK